MRIARVVGQESIAVGHHAGNDFSVDTELAYGALIDGRNEIGVSHRGVRLVTRPEVIEHREQRKCDDHPQEDVLGHVFHVVFLFYENRRLDVMRDWNSFYFLQSPSHLGSIPQADFRSV